MVLARYKLSRVALGTSVCLGQFEFDGALISTQVAWLILTLKPYDITHLFFGFKIICALTYVGKKASVEINLKLILTYKEKVVRNISRQFIFYSLAFR